MRTLNRRRIDSLQSISNMADPRRPTADKEPNPSRTGNPSGNFASPVGVLPPLQPRNQPRNQPPQTTVRTQTDISYLPPLRPQSVPIQQQSTAKIAIPRLHREPDMASTTGSSAVGDKHRVTHACESCRHRKTKCSGDRPTCKHCEDFNLTCIYEDGKRDRTRKRLDNMTKKVDGYEKLLRDLSQRAGAIDQRLIRKALEQGSTPDDEEKSPTSGHRTGSSSIYPVDVGDDNSDEADGETQVSVRAGSTESLDHINEDFNQSPATRATGFIGKISELTWMQRLKKETAHSPDVNDGALPTDDDNNSTLFHPDVLGVDMTPVHESTYHCDDLTILIADRVDPNEAPPRHVANALFQMYLDTVHPSFPIIGKLNFVSQYQRFADAPNINTGNSWKAILNLIFAIGAKYSHLVQADWRGDERDHLIYFTRARMLGFNADSVLGHADLQSVQITGLMAFYLTAINQINRAWAISGIAVRHACTLGLNMKNESKNVYESSKEIRYRVWWAVCSNDRLLAVMTGRPASIMDADCSVPLPLPLDEEKFFSVKAPDFNSHNIQLLRRYSSQESQNADNAVSTPSSAQSGKSRASPIVKYSPESQPPNIPHSQAVPPSIALYFHHHAKLSVLTSEVLNRLYRVGTAPQPWAQIQSTIATLDSRLERWHSVLPSVFDFTKRQRDQQFHRQRVSLGFFYYSTSIIISRPCLCRMNQRIPNQSERAKDFNQSTAARCVQAALGMLDLLPEEPNPVGLYGVAPWWCLLHYLVQAVTVLMLELSFRSDHLPLRVDDILLAAKKTVFWLRSMSAENISAHRAWAMCDDMLRKVAPRVGRNVDDLPVGPFMYAHDEADGMFGVFPVEENMGSLNSLEDLYRPGERVEEMSLQPNIFASYDEDEFLSTRMPYPDRPS